MKSAPFVVATFLVLGPAGCAKHHAVETLPTTAGRTSIPTPSGALTNGQIVGVLMRVNITEITEGRLVAAETTNTSVRDFANLVVAEHTAARRGVEALARSRRIRTEASPIARRISDESRAQVSVLRRTTASALDRHYVDNEIRKHRELLNTIDTALVPGTSDPELLEKLGSARSLAEAHLEHAQRLDAELPR